MATTLFVSQLFLLGLGSLSLNRCLLLVEKTNLLVLERGGGEQVRGCERIYSSRREREGESLLVASSCHLVVSSPQHSDVEDAQTHREAVAPLISILPPYPSPAC